MKNIASLLFFTGIFTTNAQVGINTKTPKVTLEINENLQKLIQQKV